MYQGNELTSMGTTSFEIQDSTFNVSSGVYQSKLANKLFFRERCRESLIYRVNQTTANNTWVDCPNPFNDIEL